MFATDYKGNDWDLAIGFSDAVLVSTIAASLPRTIVADPLNDQPMTADSESMLLGNLVSNGLKFAAAKFNQAHALNAIKMIMRRIAVIVFIHTATV